MVRISYIRTRAARPQRLVPGCRRWRAAELLHRPEGATVGELLEAFGLPPDAKIQPLYQRLYALALALQRPIHREGRGRGARYFLPPGKNNPRPLNS